MKVIKWFLLPVCAFVFSSHLASGAVGNTATQQTCTQQGSDIAPLPPNGNLTWRNAGLNRNIDRIVLRRDIVAFKIMWSTGWSNWIVVGVNDVHDFTTPSLAPTGAVDARLTWIYFYDHQHQYISCS